MEAERDLKALQARLERFRDEREWARFHSPGNLAKAINVEAAELLEIFLWTNGREEEGRVLEERRAAVESELADVLIHSLNFASATGIDLVAAAERKVKANEERYPVAKARGSARKYTEL